ncbi:MAG: hypothetical protein HC850_17065 [Rhodomicrobium sp.]|nr:hypothetical protein [Rhodomicrobium sp.]
MPSQPQTAQRHDFGPAFRMYMENLENWRKNYEKLAQTPVAPSASPPDHMSESYEQAMTQWQKSGEEMFRRFVEQQVEICRFFGKRWEQYLGLPEKFANCRSPADLSQVHMAFMGQMASDYMAESGRLAQPMNELMSNWSSMHDKG